MSHDPSREKSQPALLHPPYKSTMLRAGGSPSKGMENSLLMASGMESALRSTNLPFCAKPILMPICRCKPAW